VPQPLLPRFLEAHLERVQHAQALAQVAEETGGNVQEERRHIQTAADTKTLRGLPAIGRGVAGKISGTDPEGALLAKEHRESRKRA
jgi:hypothetical protein